MELDDNEKYLNWSSESHRKFEKDGTINMIEDLYNIVNSRYELYKSEKYEEKKCDWESLENAFIKKYNDFIKEK